MGKLEEMGQMTDKEIQKMKKREELKKELEKAKKQAAEDMKSM